MLAARHDNVFSVSAAGSRRRVDDFNEVALACLVGANEASTGHHMTTYQATQAWCPAQNGEDSLPCAHGVAWADVACNGCARVCALGIREMPFQRIR